MCYLVLSCIRIIIILFQEFKELNILNYNISVFYAFWCSNGCFFLLKAECLCHFLLHFSENRPRGIFRNVAITVLNTRWQHRLLKYGAAAPSKASFAKNTHLPLFYVRLSLSKRPAKSTGIKYLSGVLDFGCEGAALCWPDWKETFRVLLQDLMLRHGWRTAAIVPELEQETNVVSTNRYSLNLTWLQALTGLMERLQVGRWSKQHLHLHAIRFSSFSSVLFQTLQDSESKMIFHEWQKEREELRWV